MTCRYCTGPLKRRRSCIHADVCLGCHAYLYCEGKPPKVSIWSAA